MHLSANPFWTANQNHELPEVHVFFEVESYFLRVSFSVKERESCFRNEVKNHGGSSFEDSCVETFLMFPDHSPVYTNFEFTSRGYCLAARGESRFPRIGFSPKEYDLMKITTAFSQKEGSVFWKLTAEIPCELFFPTSRNLQEETISGNFYKCADLSASPHYLSLFPISTERPDFHRPDFFQILHKPSFNAIKP